MRSTRWYSPRVQLNICTSCLHVSPLDPSHLFVLSLYFHSLPPLPFRLLSFFSYVSSISLHSCSPWIQTELLVRGCCSYSVSKIQPPPCQVYSRRGQSFLSPWKGPDNCVLSKGDDKLRLKALREINEALTPVLCFYCYCLIYHVIHFSSRHLHFQLLQSNLRHLFSVSYQCRLIMFGLWAVGHAKHGITLINWWVFFNIFRYSQDNTTSRIMEKIFILRPRTH